jgi:hypothetical protein
MHTGLEIPLPPPPRPPWSPEPPLPPPHAHIEPPVIPVDPLWEYREVVRDPGIGLMTTAELDALGAEHWELAGVVGASDGVHFYFKRERRR